jgi:hypothetical protein
MKIHKLTKPELAASRDFLNAAEAVLKPERFSFTSPESKWKEWDADDDDYRLMIKLQKELAVEFGCKPEHVDDRILCYEFLKKKYYSRVSLPLLTAEVLIENVCDPLQDHLAFHPSFFVNHVTPEQ